MGDHEGGRGRTWQLKGTPNLCTDPDRWDTKKKAHLKRQAEAIAAQGETVIDGNKARAAIGADGKLKGGYVPLAGELKKAADKGKVAAVTIQDPRTGKTVRAVKADDAKAAGVKVPEPKKPASRDYDAEYRQREQADKTETARRTALYRVLRAGMVGEPRSVFELDLVIKCLIASTGLPELLFEFWPAETNGKGPRGRDDALLALLPSMSPDRKALLLLDLVLAPETRASGWAGEEEPELLYATARHYGIDHEAPIEKLLQASATEQPEEAVA